MLCQAIMRKNKELRVNLKIKKYYVWTAVLKYYTVTSYEETSQFLRPLHYLLGIIHKNCLESTKNHWSQRYERGIMEKQKMKLLGQTKTYPRLYLNQVHIILPEATVKNLVLNIQMAHKNPSMSFMELLQDALPRTRAPCQLLQISNWDTEITP